jgi:hypothetical protein
MRQTALHTDNTAAAAEPQASFTKRNVTVSTVTDPEIFGPYPRIALEQSG